MTTHDRTMTDQQEFISGQIHYSDMTSHTDVNEWREHREREKLRTAVFPYARNANLFLRVYFCASSNHPALCYFW